jgi:hypothetical protein
MVNRTTHRYPKDALGRRVRGRRTPSGKRLVLQPRDIEIFKLLRQYRFLRSTYLWALLPAKTRGKSFKRFQDRLTDLFHENGAAQGGAYLDWPPQQRLSFSARYTPSIYALSPAGEALLDDKGVKIDNITDLVQSGRMAVHREFSHAMMICDTLASIELGTRADPSVRFVPWPEIISKAPAQTQRSKNPFAIPVEISHKFSGASAPSYEQFRIIPDGLFGLEYQQVSGKKLYRFFILEAERRNRVNTRSLKGSSFLKKILAYRAIIDHEIYKSHFGIPNLLILTVAPTQARIETMKQTILDIYGTADSSMFLFRRVAALGDSEPDGFSKTLMFDAPWERSTFTEFRLNDPQDR